MDGYYSQRLPPPFYRYVSLPPQPHPGQMPRQGTGILKYPFRNYNTQKEHSAKTLRFEMDLPVEPAPVPDPPPSTATPPLATTAEGTSTDRSSTSTAVTASAESGDETEGSKTSSVAASRSRSTDVAESSVKSSSATSRASDAESGGTSGSALSSAASVSSQSVPEDFKRYFRRHNHTASGTSSILPTSRGIDADDHRGAAPQRHSWRSMSRRCALLTLLATLLTLMLAGMSADVYGTLYRGPKDRMLPAPLENTVAAALPEPEGRAMPVVPPRMVSGDAEHLEPATHESEIDTERTEPAEVGRDTEAFSDPPATNPDEILPTTISTTGDDGKETATEPLHSTEEFGGWKRERDTPPASLKSRRVVSCEQPGFTYCQQPRHEFYYENTIKDCVSAGSHQVGVCIRGANKFDSKRTCREACVEKRRLSKRCSRAPHFMECTSGDVLGTWWHFDGKSCRRWNFTAGLCPAHGGGGAFVSREDCLAACVGRRRRSRLCRVSSRPDHCYSDQLRFPYFAVAVEDEDERMPLRCLKVSSVNYNSHRCLVGDNRFRTMRACRMTCVSNRSDTGLPDSGAP
ncbi:hypothetical protein HPB52_005524 [Rhipicephalus sanguineus]|uniref:Uncharacterized protein n=1 Tax=Rhipicephalus sanguineus TaxID=34632 RepID=A0A9D4QHR3_RHISA|nr:hypothetical protein HPB52_005524 [Rhipicephalus sanguineus]